MFFETAGWERPHWYESNAGLLEEYGDAVMPREHEWDARWWSPIINAEHLRMREARRRRSTCRRSQIFDIVGPGALDTVQRTCVAQCDVAVGKVIYTPVLDAKGGFVSDLTVMRLGDDHFRVVTGGAHGLADRKWFGDQLPADGATRRPTTPTTSRRSACGARRPATSWPRSPPTTSPTRASDSVPAGDRGRLADACWPRGSPTSASSAGSSTSRSSRPPSCGTLLLEAGAAHGAVPVGIGVYGTTGRIEKGYRAFGSELDAERSIVEAGMQRPKVKAADFVGREAYLAAAGRAPRPCSARWPSTTTPRRPAQALHARRRADPHPRRRHADRRPRPPPYVTTAGSAPSLGKHVLLAYLPPEEAVIGNELAVSYMEELYPVTVGSVDATAAVRPGNERIRE